MWYSLNYYEFEKYLKQIIQSMKTRNRYNHVQEKKTKYFIKKKLSIYLIKVRKLEIDTITYKRRTPSIYLIKK